MKLNIAFPLIAIAALAACQSEPEWTRERQESVTTHRMADVSPKQAVKYAEQVLRLADNRDVNFNYSSDGFIAKRNVFLYFVFGAAMGDYRFEVSARPDRGGSIVTTKIFNNLSGVTATGPTPSSGGTLHTYADAYEAFFGRMDYLAGKSTSWPSCEGSSGLESLCLNAEDLPPPAR